MADGWDKFEAAPKSDWDQFPLVKRTSAKAPKGEISPAVDAARSVPGGAAQGLAGFVGAPSSLVNWLSNQGRALVGREPIPSESPQAATFMGLPTIGQADAAFSAPFGGYYQPQTTAGEYAQTAASFLPGALFPGGLAARAARVSIPAVASETAGQATRGTPLEPYARFAAALGGGGIAELGPTAARIANRGVGAISSGKVQLLNPATEVERRLREAFASDGGPIAAGQKAASFANSGASTPSLLDVGGGSVRRLVRAAAGGGDEAHNTATQYSDTVRADLQSNTAAAVDRLHPERRTAGQAETQFEADQANLAREQYAAPYAEPAAVTPQMVSALQGPEGRGAINRAYAAARANRDATQMAELRDLVEVAAEQSGGRNPLTGRVQSLEQALGNLSARSLDRVRIAMREIGGGLAQKGARDMARGYGARVRDIDTALDQTPGLTDARASYRQMQQQRDAIPLGQNILTHSGDEYAGEIEGLSGVGGPPNVGAGLRVGARDAMRAAILRPAAGQTGVLNRLATGTDVGRNLSNTFGVGRTAVFRDAIRNEVQRLRNANFVSPESGPQTQLRGADEGLMGGFPTSLGSFMSKVADKFLRGVSLTPAERAEIVRLGTSEADLRRFATAPASRMTRNARVGTQITSSQGNNQ